MKINLNAYEFKLLNSRAHLIRVGGSCSLIKIEEDSFVEMKRFQNLKHPSEVAVSPDETMFAVINTSGHIAVYETESGRTILCTKGLKEEGTGIFFDEKGESIIVSEWGGTIARIVLKSGEINTIVTGGKDGTTKLYNYKNRDKDDYYVLHSYSDENWAKLYKLDINNGNLEEIYSARDVYIDAVEVLEDTIVMCVEAFENDNIYIQILGKQDKKLDCILECKEYNAIKDEWGYVRHMHVNEEYNLIIISHPDGYIIINEKTERVVYKCKVEYLSQAEFLSKDMILLGTCENMMVHNVECLGNSKKDYLNGKGLLM